MECSLAAIDYRPVFDKFIRHKENEARREVDGRACVTRVERVLAIGANKRTNSDAVADSVLETLDNLGVVRTPGQKRFHREFFCACLPHIYGSDEFERDRERILKRFDFKEIRYEVLVVCPRRWGKTYGVSMFMAALMWCVPDMWISIFSTGQRASTSMLELIGKWIANLSGDGVNRILAKNHEKIYLRGDSNSDRRRCYSYPSSVQVRSPILPTFVFGSLGRGRGRRRRAVHWRKRGVRRGELQVRARCVPTTKTINFLQNCTHDARHERRGVVFRLRV